MISVDEAKSILLGAVREGPVETVALGDALGRTLAEPIAADRDFPPTDRSAMDGYAVRAADLPEPEVELAMVGELAAGAPADGVRVGPGEAVRIMTGAVIPEGADAVVMVELTEEPSPGRVTIHERPESGQHIRRRGEDLSRGGRVLDAGVRIDPPEIAALASVGCATVVVHRAPRVAVLSTGDEVVAVDAAPADHQVRNSNGATLVAQLARLGIAATELGIAGDDPEALDAALASGFEHDVLLVTGGVSMGRHDIVRERLEHAGGEVLFHKVAVRPGKPMLAIRRGATLVVGLPGNPVSAFTGFAMFVAPAIRRIAGLDRVEPSTVTAVLDAPLRLKPGRTTFHLARLDASTDPPRVTTIRTMGSGDVLSMARADAFVRTEGGTHTLAAGDRVEVVPWELPGTRGPAKASRPGVGSSA